MYPEPSTWEKLVKKPKGKGAGRAKKQSEKRDIGVNTPGFADVFLFGGGRAAASGVRVNEHTALQIVAVYAAVSYIADYVASLPKITYERLEPRGKKRALDHYLFPILHDQPNPFQNDYEFVETLTGHVLLWGNAYAEIERNGAGRVVALWPLRPDRMRVILMDREIFYFYTTPDGKEVPLREVLHLRGLASDGIIGYSPIRLARETIGIAIAEEEYRARFLGNNASPGGVLEHPGNLSKDAIERLKMQWNESHQGLSNAHRVAVLEEGIKWHEVGVPAKDMEFIEGRKFQKAEIASLYRVKPYKIGIMEPGTVSFASIEAQQIDNHVDTMRPWVKRWEKKFSRLFTDTERRKFFVEFLIDDVLRGDSLTRAQKLQIEKQNGIISTNDWLEIESRNPVPAEKGGDDYWMPSNFQVAGEEVDDDDDDAPTISNGNGNGARPNGETE